MEVKIKRVYEKYDVIDGMRILIDRLWTRGVRHDGSKVDLWLKDVAPSTELRKWFSHDPKKWVEFQKRYIKELDGNPALDKLIGIARQNDTITLLYATTDTAHNSAIILKQVLESRLSRSDND